MALNTEKIRKDFPILNRKVNGKTLVYLDSAATSQKPRQVLDAITGFYENHNANVHRGVHTLSQEATQLYDDARDKAAKFVGAQNDEIIFTRNTTEAINIVLYSWACRLKRGDEVVTTVMEHHSNIVPWQSLQKRGIKLRFADIDEEGRLRMDQMENIITQKTRLVAVTHASNVLGTINPVKEMAKMAHDAGSLVLIDGAQSVPHMPVDVERIGADFLAFSGHKMLAPSIGCLYGKSDILKNMPPFMLGSDEIKEVSLRRATFREPPWRFETGTPDIAGAIGLGAAVDYLNKIGMRNVREHEKELVRYALKKLDSKDIIIYGPKNPDARAGVISFNLGDIHSHDLATILDERGIAIRSGHHCAMPLMQRLGIAAASRASFYLYNTRQEIDVLAEALEHAREVFKL